MKGKIGDKQRLLHILESISEIEKYTSGANLESFLENSMMLFASVKQIEIIGEAANYITEETKSKFTDIQWRQIVGLRHILVHEIPTSCRTLTTNDHTGDSIWQMKKAGFSLRTKK